MAKTHMIRPAWAEIDLAAIAHNISELRRVMKPDARIMAVVKANAYGHGAVPVSKVVLANGADYLGVAILQEARELREAGIDAPILILGYTPDEQVQEVVELEITQTVYSYAAAEAISRAAQKAGKTVKVHIKADTGMGRIGFISEIGTPEEIVRIAGLPGIEVEGMFTHFSVADSRDKEYTSLQFDRFRHLDSQLAALGLDIPVKHAANTAAVIDLPEMHLNMVRVGIGIYGLYPSNEVLKDKVDLKPALSLKTRIAQVKTVGPGASISYGRTYITDRETRIATIPLGYADGYTRLFSNRVSAILHGRRVPQIGNVCMDQFMIDVTDVPEAETGDQVILIGRQGTEEITVDELGDIIGTINYEIVCMLSERIPRLYIGE